VKKAPQSLLFSEYALYTENANIDFSAHAAPKDWAQKHKRGVTAS
jgi:hypothetical protein